MIREGSVQIPFSYAAGEAGSRFLIALRDHKTILGARCTDCERVLCPPPPACAVCGAAEFDPVAVGPAGVLVSWTEVPGRGVYGLVRLDGADTAMLHLLLGDDSRRAAGRRLRARFRGERTGSILDIEGFELAEESQ